MSETQPSEKSHVFLAQNPASWNALGYLSATDGRSEKLEPGQCGEIALTMVMYKTGTMIIIQWIIFWVLYFSETHMVITCSVYNPNHSFSSQLFWVGYKNPNETPIIDPINPYSSHDMFQKDQPYDQPCCGPFRHRGNSPTMRQVLPITGLKGMVTSCQMVLWDKRSMQNLNAETCRNICLS